MADGHKPGARFKRLVDIGERPGNRACVNPHHLEVTTTAGNCRHGNGTKVTPEIVAAIRQKEPQWGDRIKIARKYGISPSTVSDIRNGRSWVV